MEKKSQKDEDKEHQASDFPSISSIWTPWVYEHRCWRQGLYLSICRTLQRDGTQTERGLQGSAPEMRELVCARQTFTKGYSFRLDLWWKCRQTWHSWYWTAVQLWGCIHEGLQSADVELHSLVVIPGHAVCLNAMRLREQGSFMLERDEKDEKRALCDGTTAGAKK